MEGGTTRSRRADPCRPQVSNVALPFSYETPRGALNVLGKQEIMTHFIYALKLKPAALIVY